MVDHWENSNSTLAEQWAGVRGQLRAEVGDAAFNSWLKPLTLGEILGSRLRITVPTRFMRDWIEQNYGDRLTELWQEKNSGVTEVEIIVEPISTLIKTPSLAGRDKDGGNQSLTAIPLSDQGDSNGEGNLEQFDTKNVTDLLDKRFTFKNFINSQSFIIKVGEISEKENHHPDINFGWGYAKIVITTHAIEGLSENDFILAAKIDQTSNV